MVLWYWVITILMSIKTILHEFLNLSFGECLWFGYRTDDHTHCSQNSREETIFFPVFTLIISFWLDSDSDQLKRSISQSTTMDWNLKPYIWHDTLMCNGTLTKGSMSIILAQRSMSRSLTSDSAWDSFVHWKYSGGQKFSDT